MIKKKKNKRTLPLTKKMIIPIIGILIMSLGYCKISTSFFLDGTLGIEEGLFDVRFTTVKSIGEDVTKDTVSEDGKKFTALLTDKKIYTYEITNFSKDYDTSVNVICMITPENIEFKNTFNNQTTLLARTSRTGRVTIELPTTMTDVTVLTCSLNVEKIERTKLGSEKIEKEGDYLIEAESPRSLGYDTPSSTYLGYTLDRDTIETINLVTSNEIPSNATFIGDVSKKKNGSIVMYSLDEDSDSMKELYIGQNGGVRLNPNSNFLFYLFPQVTEINGLDMIDTMELNSMYYMFYGNSSLTSLNVSNFDTSEVTNMSKLFSKCSALVSLDVSHFITNNVITMNGMFQDCEKLTLLNLQYFNTAKVTDMTWMFDGCSALTSLDVSGFETSNVKDMRAMFDGCQNLTTLDVGHFNTSQVTNMRFMFYDCQNLTELDVSGFDTSNATDIAYMFYNCIGLTSLDVSRFKTNNVTDMSGMFAGAYLEIMALTEIKGISNWNTAKVKDMNCMFRGCSNLIELDVSHFETGNVTDMNYMFANCEKLTVLDVSGFETSKVTNMYYMFNNCNGLTTLDVSHFNTSQVTTMANMFRDCSNLTSLDVSHFDTSNVTSFFGMFGECGGLTLLDVSKWNTSNVTNMEYTFHECINLTNLDVSEWDTSNVTRMMFMFYKCNNLSTTITIRGTKCTSYLGMFTDVATSPDTQITVNYTSDAFDLVDKMIESKGYYSNVKKGEVVE